MDQRLLAIRLALLATSMLALSPDANGEPFRTFDNGGGDANFGTATNWDSDTVPGENEGAVINVYSPNVTLLITSDQTASTLRINDGRTVTQSAGTLTISDAAGGEGNEELGLWVGEYGWNNVFNMQGGSIVINDTADGLILGKTSGAQGAMNFSGGTITNTASDTFIGADKEGTWNQTGGTLIAGTVYLARWNWNNGDPGNIEKGVVNLDGGTFAATRVQKGDGNEAFFYFNGGTLQARASVTDFFHSMTRANVRNGGAIIDTNGYDVTASQALLHSNSDGDNATDGGLAKNRAGTLTLTGWSEYTGETNVNAGTLAIGSGGSLYNGGAIAGNIKVNNGGTLSFLRTDTFGNAAHTNPVTLTVNAGGNVTSNGQFNSVRDIVLDGGTITANGGLYVEDIGEIGAYGFNGTVTANGAVTSTVANGGESYNFIRIGREGTSESTTFDVTDAAGVLAVNVPLTDNFSAASGLVKGGPGTMVVGAANTYTGATQVNAGTLVVNGDQSAATGNVAVSNSGTRLEGSGTIGGATTINGAAIHSPGTGVGTQTFSSSLTYGNGSIFEWDLATSKDGEGLDGDTGSAGTDFDGVSVTGNIAVGTGTVFSVILGSSAWTDMQNTGNAFWNTPYVTQVWNMSAIFGKSFTSGAFASVQTNHDVSSYGSFTIDGTSLTWTAVPELSNLAVGALLAAGLLRRRRSRGGGCGAGAAGGRPAEVAAPARAVDRNACLRFLLTFAAVLVPAGVRADLFEWNPQSGDDFGTDGNWRHNGVQSGIPGAQDLAVNNVNNATNTVLRITGGHAVDSLRISDGRSVAQSGGTLTIANTGVVWDRGLWIGEFGTGNFYTLDGGGIVIDDDWDALIIGKNSDTAGTLNLLAGSITLANPNADPNANEVFIGADGAGTWNQSGGSFQGRIVTLAKWAPASSTGTVNLDGGTFAATQVRKGAGTSAWFNFNGGTLQALASNGSFLDGLDRANVRDGGAVVDTNGFDVTVAQPLVHSGIGGDNATDGGLAKNGAGTLTLTGWSDYTGETNVNAGTLAIGGGASLYNGGAIAGTIKVNSNGTLRFDRTDTFGIASTLSPVVLEVNSGGNVLSNGQLNSIRHVVLNGGTITANGGLGPDYGAYGLNGWVTANGAVTSTLADGGGEANFIRIGREGTNEATTFAVTDAAGVLDVNVELRDNFGGGASGLAKTGPGTLVLDANTSHSGPTTVAAGTLVANGIMSGSGAVEVAAGATLAGSGTLGGATTVSGTLAPGASLRTLAFASGLTLAGFAEFEIDPTVTLGLNADLADVTGGTLSYGGTLDVTYGGPGSDFASGMSFNLFDAATITGSFATVNLPDLAGTGLAWHNNLATDGTITVIPEPRAALLGALGVLALLRRRR